MMGIFVAHAAGASDDEMDPNIRAIEMGETSLANLELGNSKLNSTTNNEQSGAKDVKPKRKVTKQPLLNADRVLGKRGIRELEKIFQDFEPTGK